MSLLLPFCFTNAAIVQLLQTANRTPRNTTTMFYRYLVSLSWKTGNLSAAIFSVASRCPKAGVANTSIAIDRSIAESQLVDRA